MLKREHMVPKYAKDACCRDRRMGPPTLHHSESRALSDEPCLSRTPE